MTGRQEVGAAVDRDEFRIGRIDKHLDLVLGIGDGIDHIGGSLVVVSTKPRGRRGEEKVEGGMGFNAHVTT